VDLALNAHMNNHTECFELIECHINKIIFENQSDYIVSILVNDDEYGLTLNSNDGTLLTFCDSGCAENPHINIIHQVFLKFLEQSGFSLSRVIIEAKYGDVIYCRLHWANESKDIYNIIGIGDALILQSLTQSPMFISKFVLDQFEKFDSEGYMESFES
jgi:Domain of unknown function (DUF151)